MDHVRKAAGRVIIGIRPAGAAKSRETGRVPGIAKREALAARGELEKLGVKITGTFHSMAAVVAEIPPDDAPRIAGLPFVDYVAADEGRGVFPGTSAAAPTGAAMLADTVDWGVLKIGADKVWGSTTGNNAILTIIDTGIDLTHLVSGDGPGAYGLNVDVACLWVPSGQVTSCYQPDNIAGKFHGSHIAGVAAARANQVGYRGVAYGAFKVNSIRIGYWNGTQWTFTTGDLAKAIDWTTTHPGRQVVNLSVNYAGSDPQGTLVQTAVVNSYNAGNLLVGAAGNRGFDGGGVARPAKYSQVLAVTGVNSGDIFAAQFQSGCPVDATQSTRIPVPRPTSPHRSMAGACLRLGATLRIAGRRLLPRLSRGLLFYCGRTSPAGPGIRSAVG